ncbi:hypothetical protein N9D23_02390 [Rubripirellula sp.]|jgi:hypothetical protein|nr:hypothetical protein [Rubripirellula sp.]MDF1840783.1 hypothetical protein [Rubripirellula sp.]
MVFYGCRVSVCWLCGFILTLSLGFAAEKKPSDFEIDVAKLEPVTPETKHAIQDCLIDLESTPLLVQRLAVVVTGEVFTGGRIEGQEAVNAKQFAIGWVTQAGAKNQRVIFQGASLLNPVLRDRDGQRYVQSSANSFDQLKRGDEYFEARGPKRYPMSRKPRLAPLLKVSGVFYPTTATTATATEWYRGSAANPLAARVEIERLVSSYQEGKKTIAEFYYQSNDSAVLHRFIVFEGGVPIQVEDRMAMSTPGRFRLVSLLQPKSADLEQMKRTRESAVPVARTQTKWKKIQADLQVPIEIRSRTINGPHAIEFVANCVWLTNEKIKPVAFEPTSVGTLTPLQLID